MMSSSRSGRAVLLVSFLFWSFQAILALPTGAPSTACVSMYPQHPGPNGPASAQPGLVVPFQIQVSPIQGVTRAYRVSIIRNPNFPGQPNLLGFFLQVRDPNSEQPLGEWKNLPQYARVGDCGGTSTVTHLANTPKPIDQGLELTWEPTNLPLNSKSLQILGTFVQNMQTFWVKVPSQIFDIATDEGQVSTASVNAGGTTSFGTTDLPISSINHNNVDGTNDRRNGFGNSPSGSSPVQPQGPTFRLNNGVECAAAGFFTLLAGLAAVL